MNLFESILSPVVAGTRNWVRFGHVPKRPRRAGAKILITKHKYAVELPKEVPEYLRDLVDGTTKEAPHKMHLVTRLKENGKLDVVRGEKGFHRYIFWVLSINDQIIFFSVVNNIQKPGELIWKKFVQDYREVAIGPRTLHKCVIEKDKSNHFLLQQFLESI